MPGLRRGDASRDASASLGIAGAIRQIHPSENRSRAIINMSVRLAGKILDR